MDSTAGGLAELQKASGAQFGLVVPRDAQGPGVRSLADLRGKRVGIVAGTIALAEKDHALARFDPLALPAGDQRAGLSGDRRLRLLSDG